MNALYLPVHEAFDPIVQAAVYVLPKGSPPTWYQLEYQYPPDLLSSDDAHENAKDGQGRRVDTSDEIGRHRQGGLRSDRCTDLLDAPVRWCD